MHLNNECAHEHANLSQSSCGTCGGIIEELGKRINYTSHLNQKYSQRLLRKTERSVFGGRGARALSTQRRSSKVGEDVTKVLQFNPEGGNFLTKNTKNHSKTAMKFLPTRPPPARLASAVQQCQHGRCQILSSFGDVCIQSNLSEINTFPSRSSMLLRSDVQIRRRRRNA